MLLSVLRGVPSFSKWTLCAAVLVTVVIGIQLNIRVHVEVIAPGDSINDFDRWMLMTPRFLHEGARSVDDRLPTPPLSLMVFAPFTALSRGNAQSAWVFVKGPLFLLTFLLSLGMVSRTGIRPTASALGFVVACWWLAVIVDLQEGQMNVLALLPLVAGLYVAQQETRYSDIAAGSLIGLAIAVKVTPVVFLAYFHWRRRWLVGLAGAASLVVWLVFLPALMFGWSQNLQWLGEWAGIMIVPYVAEGRVVYTTTQSVGSFAMRLLSPVAAFDANRNDILQHGYMNLAALSGSTVQWIVRGLMLSVGVAGLIWMRRPLQSLRSQRYVLETGAVAAFMLWFSERTWVHHYVSFILTLSAAAMVLSDPEARESSRRWLARALMVFAVASLFVSEAGRLSGPHGVEWAKAIGVYLWPSVLVTAATLLAAASPESRAASPESQAPSLSASRASS